MAPLIQNRSNKRAQRGQALVEYALILALLAIAMAVALAATGPAIADVFSNVICNVAGQNPCGSEVADLSPAGDPSAFWQTVTWVASNPRVESPYPTPPLRPPTLEPTIGGPSNTNTPVNTRTPVPTAVLGPSATPPDKAFYLPFNEPVKLDPNSRANWRLDQGVYLGGDEWFGYYYQNTSFSGTPIRVSNVSIPGANPLNVNFNWGAGAPITDPSWSATDNFSVSFVRRIQVPAGGLPVRFNLTADDRASLYLCPTEAAALALSGCDQILNNVATGTQTRNLAEGPQWLVVRYVENSGDASVRLDLVQMSGVSPDDVVGAGGECAWGIKTNSDVNTLDSMFDENPNSDTWPGGQVCYLELRGWVDTAGASRPVLSFWDVWDLPAGVNASLQVADYTEDHTALAWRTIPLRNGGTNVRNYEWTRNDVPLANVTPGLTTTRLAVRFMLSSAGQSGSFNPARWYVDDIQVNDTPESIFTVGQTWNFNGGSQKADFVTSGRWDLTTTRTHGSLSFEDSPGRDYDIHSQGTPRIHYIELANPVDVTAATAPAADSEGDTGVPLLSFWHAFQVAPGTQLQVQYTRDPRDTIPDVWNTIGLDPTLPVGLLYNNTGSTVVPSLVMRPIEILLSEIPNWNTAPFRLRFALIVLGSTTSDGWWVDDIKIERDGGARYTAYPFIDGAENDDFTEKNWVRLGTWATQLGLGVRENGFQTGRAYADSLNTNSMTNASTSMEMKRYIDLFYDTPANTSDPGGAGEALTGTVAERQNVTRPMLTFWHRRDVRAGTTFAIDMTTADLEDADSTTDLEWHQIWSYTAPTSNPSNSITRWYENAWERVEIDLSQALLTTTASNLNALRTGGTNTDDDFRIRFRIVSGNTTGDGVLIDWIQIKELPELVHRLWDGTHATYGAGNGSRLEDYVETVFPASLPSVRERWYVDVGEWTMMQETPTNGDIARSGSFAFHDSPQADASSLNDYPQDAYVILELRTIIDLRGTDVAKNPTLYYWQRYSVQSNDRFRVEVAVEDTTQTVSQQNRLPGWAAWQEQNPLPYTEMGNGSNGASVGWQQQMLSLNSFVGKRIRLRWVINSMNSSNDDDGWYLDNVRFAYNGFGAGTTTPVPLPFFDDAQSVNNWIMEGTWGLASDHFRSSLGDSGGPTLWRGYWFKCGNAPDGNQISSEGCSWSGMFNTYQRSWPKPGTTATTLPALGPYTGPLPPTENVSSIYTLMDPTVPGETPLGGTLGSDYTDNTGARYMRVITFNPGVYTFQISHDDAARIWVNNTTDLAGLASQSNGWIYNNTSYMDRSTLTTKYIAVNSTGPITRIVGADMFNQGGPGHLYLNVGRDSHSFTDSPNLLAGSSYSTVYSQRPAKTAMILNGYFNLSGLTDPTLQFYYIGDLRNSARLYVEFSSNGGFNWTELWNWGNGSSWTPDWNRATIRFASNSTFNALSATAKSRIMIRFRLNSGSNNRDGIYLADIAVEDP
ncbi:MAG: hypothetical protein IT320_20285 [Anaerolineae bacterium]|nr:hypothetical protein [Anaerolineae bacterium]